jgi:hypothetical protein
MRFAIILALLLAGLPAMASPEQNAAMAYCAAKAAGRSDQEASDAAATQISRGRGLGYVMFYRQQIRDQVQYLIGQQCPDSPPEPWEPLLDSSKPKP